MHCIKIGKRFWIFWILCFSGFCEKMSSFFRKNLGTRYVVLGVLLVDCVMKVLCFLVHGKSMVRWAGFGFLSKKIESFSNNFKTRYDWI